MKVGKLVELQSETDFQKVLEYVLEKNKELYEKLAGSSSEIGRASCRERV